MIILKDWSLIHEGHNAYTAPELFTSHLAGEALNHPKLGKSRVVTSPIVNVKGRIVYTKSGSVYKLGRIDTVYRKWIKKNYGKWDWRNPIIMKEV